MIRWIFWIIIILWLLSKLKFLFASEATADNHQKYSDNARHHSNKDKQLKNDAGDYVDYEEMKP